VESLAFLSIQQGVFLLLNVQVFETMLYRNAFSAAC
jgi:hypothetical protein